MSQWQKLGVSLIFFFQINTSWGQSAKIEPAQFLAGACISCHTLNTTTTSAIPSLVGVPSKSILSDMLDYANDKRAGLLMPQIAKGYTREQMEMIANYFSSLEPL
ncbi:c-type cytochrome [Advenella kashmirensis]|nr:cytochrome C [Advenella kashmirensis]